MDSRTMLILQMLRTAQQGSRMALIVPVNTSPIMTYCWMRLPEQGIVCHCTANVHPSVTVPGLDWPPLSTVALSSNARS